MTANPRIKERSAGGIQRERKERKPSRIEMHYTKEREALVGTGIIRDIVKDIKKR